MIILKMGNIPVVEFLESDLYCIVEKYTFVAVSSQSFKYAPSRAEIEYFYKSNGYDLDYLCGKKAHTKEAKELYNFAVRQIEPDPEKLIEHLINIASKLYFLKNEIDVIFRYFCLNVPRYYSFLDEETIYKIVEKAQSIPYKPTEKCAVFNPKYNLNPIFKQHITQTAIGEYNHKIVVELAEKGHTREQISIKSNLSLTTVDDHLKKAGISTKGNKKAHSINLIKECHKTNPRWSKKRVSEHLKMSYVNVKRLWKEIENQKNS